MAGDGDFCSVPGHGRKWKIKGTDRQWCPHSGHDPKPDSTNVWKVLWSEGGAKKFRNFRSDPPTPAIQFAKELKKKQITVELISGHPFPPTKKHLKPDKPGLLWCPYCIKWRDFQELVVRDAEGLLTPALLRCPVCYISIRDVYVRHYNPDFYRRWETEQEQRRLAATAKKAAKSATKVYNPRRNRG